MKNTQSIQSNDNQQAERPRPASNGIFLTILAAFATLALLWAGGEALPSIWRILVALYGAIMVSGILSVLFRDN